MMLKTWPLGRQIIALMLLIALAAGVVGLVGMNGMEQIQANSRQTMENAFLPFDHLAELRSHMQAYRSDILLVLSLPPADRTNAVQQAQSEKDTVDKLLAESKNISRTPTENQDWQALIEAWQTYGTSVNSALSELASHFGTILNSVVESATLSTNISQALTTIAEESQEIQAAVRQVVAGSQRNMEESEITATAAEEQNATVEELQASAAGLETLTQNLKTLLMAFKLE
ncbi:MAG: MCP four helix bundle domain-containing protein [Desulfitobacteriaceae bacterium]